MAHQPEGETLFGTFRVKNLMTRNPVVVRAGERLGSAKDVMATHRLRHLPIISDETGDLVGVVSQRDLLWGTLDRVLASPQAPAEIDELPVEDVMSRELVEVQPDTPIADAANLITEKRIGCLPVVERGRLVGILTEADFVELMRSENRRREVRRELE